MNLEKTMKALQRRGFGVQYFDTSAQAVAYLQEQIQGKTVGFGGSMTAKDMGLDKALAEKNEILWHWIKETPAEKREQLVKALTADVYITSANAMTEDGQILNIDGTGNRLAASVFGHETVYVVAGTNKICPDFDSALDRARNVASVKNAARFGLSTPCQVDGKCHDCHSPQRICRALEVLWTPMMGMDTQVILVGEELGF